MSNAISELITGLNKRPTTHIESELSTSASASPTSTRRYAKNEPEAGNAVASSASIDPGSISSVEQAVLYLRTVVAGDAAVVSRIRRMKKHQDDHEALWLVKPESYRVIQCTI